MEQEQVALDARTCEDLLDHESVGRAAFVVAGRPHVQVVAYVRAGEHLELAAGAGSPLARVGDGALVALQVDRVDRDRACGWSVVATGPVAAGAPLGDGSCTVSLPLRHDLTEVVGRWVGVRPGELAAAR